MPRPRASGSTCTRGRKTGQEALFRRHPAGPSTSTTPSWPPTAGRTGRNRLGNPVWHMHSGNPPGIDMPVPFALLLNLVSASNAQNKDVLWGFISRYAPGVTPETHPELDRLAGYAIRYFDDFVKPTKVYRAPDEVERQALASAVDKRLARCRPMPTARRSRTPRSTSRARSSAIRTMPSRAPRAGRACRSPSSR